MTKKLKLYNGKKKASSTNGAGITGYRHEKEKIDPYLSLCTKLKFKWIKDLNINPATLNIIEEKVESNFERMGTGDHFQIITPVPQTLKL